MILSRRTLLTGAAAATALAAVPATAHAAPSWERRDPFTLGVASGDPEPGSVVLWTRLAPDPLAEDGTGGMPARAVPVWWEVALDATFRRVVRAGVAFARPELGHSVHVEVAGLRPDTGYAYRFRVGTHLSPIGHTTTAPAPGSLDPLVFGVVSCSNWEQGHFTAYRRIVEDGARFVAHLGDYIYETTTARGAVRSDARIPTEMFTLRDYRLRHAQHKTDTDAQFAHAAVPWILTWDDHEVSNNYANLDENQYDRPPVTREQFAVRRAAAYQAYYEHMPLRRTSVPRGATMPIYRTLRWGALADFQVLDTRQYRDDQVLVDWATDETPEARRRYDASRSILGTDQERWLAGELGRRGVRWNVLTQQIFFMQNIGVYDYGVERYFDGWDGYVASRQRVIAGWQRAGVRSPIVLSGDFHENWAGDVKADFDRADSPTVASEFLVSSVSSGGDGVDADRGTAQSLADNPHVKLVNRQRGHLVCRVDPQQWRTEYRVLDTVTRPGGTVRTRAAFTVAQDRPGITPA